MLPLTFAPKPEGLNVLCLGAHCDDIEIGCGGTVMRWIDEGRVKKLKWVVFTSSDVRKREAVMSAEHFTEKCQDKEVTVHAFRDGFLPYEAKQIKLLFEDLKAFSPDIILTHCRHDLHQDHRTINELTWNTFRDHLIFEYEIPKYDGDLGSPNAFVPLDKEMAEKKTQLLLLCFKSQRTKHWFEEETFFSLMRIRGIESALATKYAEGFYVRKLVM